MPTWQTICDTIPSPAALLIGLAVGIGLGTLLGFGLGVILGVLACRVYQGIRRTLPRILRVIYGNNAKTE